MFLCHLRRGEEGRFEAAACSHESAEKVALVLASVIQDVKIGNTLVLLYKP